MPAGEAAIEAASTAPTPSFAGAKCTGPSLARGAFEELLQHSNTSGDGAKARVRGAGITAVTETAAVPAGRLRSELRIRVNFRRSPRGGDSQTKIVGIVVITEDCCTVNADRRATGTTSWHRFNGTRRKL